MLGRHVPSLLTLAALLVIATGGGIVALAAVWAPQPRLPGHAYLHVGCSHGSHGPRWHDGHAASLGQRTSTNRSVDMTARSLVAGRPR